MQGSSIKRNKNPDIFGGVSSSSSSESLPDPTLDLKLKPLQTNLLMERSKLHENLLFEKKYYENELRKQFGLGENESMKDLISYLRNYYDWFYEAGRTKRLITDQDSQ
jgi:hypothetical protein